MQQLISEIQDSTNQARGYISFQFSECGTSQGQMGAICPHNLIPFKHMHAFGPT
jgi:hypothetical protein